MICPTLGCASQGDTREEALEMIAEAITPYLDAFARDGGTAPHDHDAMARALTEHSSDGCAIEKAAVHPVDWDAIILRCDDLIARGMASSKTVFERDNAYLNKGDDGRAIADYDAAIALIPTAPKPTAGVATLNSTRETTTGPSLTMTLRSGETHTTRRSSAVWRQPTSRFGRGARAPDAAASPWLHHHRGTEHLSQRRLGH